MIEFILQLPVWPFTALRRRAERDAERDAPYLQMVRTWMESPANWSCYSSGLRHRPSNTWIWDELSLSPSGAELEVNGTEVVLTRASRRELYHMAQRLRQARVATTILRTAENSHA